MFEQTLVQLLLLLGVTLFIVLLFQRLRIPSSLGYLAAGVLLGPGTAGPVIAEGSLSGIAEFGIVFLLFSIGLSFPPAQIRALRSKVLGLGLAQVGLTTIVVALVGYALGLSAPAAFIVGAVFAQSSTTIISRQLMDQGEYQSRHGRLGTAMSVFQDITAVPFVVIIPVLGAASTAMIAGALGIAMAKAVLAMALVIFAGRYLLRPLLHVIAQRRSAELFTLAVLFVSLVAAGVTDALGLSKAFGAFLVGMVIAETEFRHLVESTIRPFRDVLLGVFFVSIGMLINPLALPGIWPEVVGGALLLLVVKALLVTAIVRTSGVDLGTALRTALLLAVGGEFGFALLAIGLEAGAIDGTLGQSVLMAVLLSMVLGALLIRFNFALAERLTPRHALQTAHRHDADSDPAPVAPEGGHVILCGYGRTGQVVGKFLQLEQQRYVALDIDPVIARESRLAGQPVYLADAAEAEILTAIGIETASLLVICHSDRAAALRTLGAARLLRPNLPIIARTRDERDIDELRRAGATEVIPETQEAGLIMVSHSLLSLSIPAERISRYIREQRAQHYPLLQEIFVGSVDALLTDADTDIERLHAFRLGAGSSGAGRALAEAVPDAADLLITAIVRKGQTLRYPPGDTVLEAGDVVVALGGRNRLLKLEKDLTSAQTTQAPGATT